MSNIALSGNASGTGTFTIASPDSNSDRTLDLPDAAGTIQVSGNPISGTTGSFSGDLSFNSGYGSAAVAYGCRAWVNFNGTTSPGTIRGSGNVSSVTRNGTGDYTVNFTTAMPDANYVVTTNAIRPGGSATVIGSTGGTTSGASVQCRLISSPGGTANEDTIMVSIFR
jgi:multidrug efflux pump subunit AcrA (membrane-fusion protein)